MRFNISLLLGFSLLMSCSSKNSETCKKDYSLEYSKLEVEKTLIRNKFSLNDTSNSKPFFKETYFFTECSCVSNGDSLKLTFKDIVRESVEKTLTITIRDDAILNGRVIQILDGDSSKKRMYVPSQIELFLDKSDSIFIKGTLNVFYERDEVDQIMTDSFEGKFVCDKSTINLD